MFYLCLIFEQNSFKNIFYATLTQFGITKSYTLMIVIGKIIPIWKEINFSKLIIYQKNIKSY